MPKGSQLKQLKQALSHTSKPGRESANKLQGGKRSVVRDAKKKSEKLAKIQEKLNPFDLKITRPKHDVGGRKIKGIVGKPGVSKQAGIDQRNRTLLKEYDDRHRAGEFVDRRFAENDPTVTPEERMLERFTRERQRASKGHVFNLDEGEDTLTHYGQSLSNLDDFDQSGIQLDDDDDIGATGHVEATAVKHTHFAGFNDEDKPRGGGHSNPKSKAEVMSELISKSKEYKAQRQLVKQRDDQTRNDLDDSFDALRSLLFSAGSSETVPSWDGPIKDDANYDQHVHELAFDSRARAKDRTKTEEERALEAKEALQKAEQRRLKRMFGDVDDDDDKMQPRRKRHRGGDDLDDDFTNDDNWDLLGEGLTVEQEAELRESHSSDNLPSGNSLELEGVPTRQEDRRSDFPEVSRQAHSQGIRTIQHALPFTFTCPSTHEEFLEITRDFPDADLPVVVERIRTLYHPSLAEDNKLKLQKFIDVLVDQLLHVASSPRPNFKLISQLTPHLFSLSRTYPVQSAECFVSKLFAIQQKLLQELVQGPLDANSRTWPGPAELALLHVAGVVWSSSDLHHAVISPARLLMGTYLELARVKSLQDLGSGLFICSLFLQYEVYSRRLVPEAIAFLAQSLLQLLPVPENASEAVPYSGAFIARPSLSIRPADLKLSDPIRTPDLIGILSGTVPDVNAKQDLLTITISLLDRFAELYKGVSGFIELLHPVQDILNLGRHSVLPQVLCDRITSLQIVVNRLIEFSIQTRFPLTLQAHKPIPIPSYVPRFETSSSNYFRAHDPDHQRNEVRKLQHQVKKEKKGAMRELRKDARFLADVRHSQQKEKDKSYKARMAKVFGSIEGERAEQKAMDREKEKLKRRSGRK